jgi:hypothetical protein
MGVIFNGVDTKEQAVFAVRSMRYPPIKGARHPDPAGIRGYGPTGAQWVWGLNAADYERHADVWPLNPEGDLLATVMIESAEGLKNLDEIASVPGVGALFLGAGQDLARSLGIRPGTPELEAAFQQVLRACKSHKVACAITAGDAADVVKRVKEGWSINPLDGAGHQRGEGAARLSNVRRGVSDPPGAKVRRTLLRSRYAPGARARTSDSGIQRRSRSEMLVTASGHAIARRGSSYISPPLFDRDVPFPHQVGHLGAVGERLHAVREAVRHVEAPVILRARFHRHVLEKRSPIRA